MSHLDVVPATNLDAWESPPFSGSILNGYIYGRGTIDVKQSVMVSLQVIFWPSPIISSNGREYESIIKVCKAE